MWQLLDAGKGSVRVVAPSRMTLTYWMVPTLLCIQSALTKLSAL